jgi:hypothetical protein
VAATRDAITAWKAVVGGVSGTVNP